jgi:hypothetical protein
MDDEILMSTEVNAVVDEDSPDIIIMVRGLPKIRLTQTAALDLSNELRSAYDQSMALPKPIRATPSPRKK